jgi:RNA-directed DNA polymerase
VARPWERKFLGFTLTAKDEARLMAAPQSAQRLQRKLRELLREGRGRNLATVIVEINRVTRGWMAYYRIAQVQTTFEELDKWLRHRLRCILWRQWKKPRTRRQELIRRGLSPERATALAYAGLGPWACSQFRAMHVAVPNAALSRLGLLSLLAEWRRFACSS